MDPTLRRLGIVLTATMMAISLFGVLSSFATMISRAPPIEIFFLEAPVADARLLARRVITPDIAPVGQLRDNVVKVMGTFQCLDGQDLVLLRVTVTQGSTTATGEAELACTGHSQRWVVYARTSDASLLLSGGASVHIWSKTQPDQKVFEWERAARLVGPK